MLGEFECPGGTTTCVTGRVSAAEATAAVDQLGEVILDNGTGRYFAQERAARDGRRWVTVAPVDTATLCARIGEMVGDITF